MEIIELLRCPNCDISMRLMCGNACFSYWFCKTCHTDFEFDIIAEQFTDKKERRYDNF